MFYKKLQLKKRGSLSLNCVSLVVRGGYHTTLHFLATVLVRAEYFNVPFKSEIGKEQRSESSLCCYLHQSGARYTTGHNMHIWQ